MRALSISQPWAYLITRGLKDVENRSRRCNLRERIYVHAPIEPDLTLSYMDLTDLLKAIPSWVERNRFLSYFENLRCTRNHLSARQWRQEMNIAWCGGVVGEVTISDCVDHHDSPWFTGPHGLVLTNPVEYDRIIPARGRQGWFSLRGMAA